MLVELIGPELGLLDQELAKLALMAGEDERSRPRWSARSVGGWRTKTTWEMLDAALDGKVREAMLQLDRLLASGEQPVGILGQISASLRRFAAATRLVLQAEAARRRANLRGALEQAGVRSFVLQKAERQLRLLGRHRGASFIAGFSGRPRPEGRKHDAAAIDPRTADRSPGRRARAGGETPVGMNSTRP